MINALRKAIHIFIPLAGYLLFTLSIFLLFLYLNFPFKKTEKRVISLIEEDGSIKITKMESLLKPPANFTWKGIRIDFLNIPFFNEIEMDTISIQLKILPLLRKQIVADFSAEGIGGRMDGLLVARKDTKGFLYNIRGRGANLDLGRVIQDAGEKKNNIAGRLRADLDYSWSANDPSRGDGMLDLEVTGFKARNIEINGFPIRDIGFSSISGKIVLKRGVLNLEKLTAKTTDMEITGSGNIIMGNNLTQSMLNLAFNIITKGEGPNALLLAPLTPQAKGSPIVLSVKGSLDHPLYYINDIKLNR